MPARNDDLRDALKRAASALKAHGPEFALAGSYALWAYGGPGTRARRGLRGRRAGHRGGGADAGEGRFHASTARRRTGCSRRASARTSSSTCCTGSTGCRSTRTMIRSAEELDVLAIRMPVLSPTHVVTEKLNSLNEHHCDFAALLPGGPRGPRAGGLGPGARRHRRQRLRGGVSGAHRPAGHHRADCFARLPRTRPARRSAATARRNRGDRHRRPPRVVRAPRSRSPTVAK